MGTKGILGRTRICGVIGDPLIHTLSPLMHNAAFEKLKLDYVYLPFKVRREDLGKAMDGMRTLNIRGMNVTLPHKVAVIPFLDEIGEVAERIGAVNTIVNEGGILRGYNTDATGFLQSMLEDEVEPEGKNIVILGAGGASKAVSFILAERGANLVILNRQLELHWAEELASRLSKFFNREISALELNEANLADVLKRAEILVNTTCAGMTPNVDETPVPAHLLKPELVVYDVVYNPIETRLLKEAKEAGAKIIRGLEMLVWQGALAFELWTGEKPPVDLMKRVIVKALREHEK